MQITSLGYRTSLALLEISGSEVEDRGSFTLVRTPLNPTFWWGNFIIIPDPPHDADQAAHWLETFEREFPEAEHRVIAVDHPAGVVEDLSELARIGFETAIGSVLTTTEIIDTPHPNNDAEIRPLTSDDDWIEQVELALADEGPSYTREFCEAQARAQRDLVEAGHGRWYGAFLGGMLRASLGIFAASPGLGRYQNVKTHPDARNLGLAGTLITAAGRYALDPVAGLGLQKLVIVADPDYLAIKIYRSAGFEDTEVQLEAERKPASLVEV